MVITYSVFFWGMKSRTVPSLPYRDISSQLGLWTWFPLNLQGSKMFKAQEYGTGISLYFRFTISLVTAMMFAALLTLPLLILNSTGTGLTDVDVGAGEPGFFAVSSIGNFLSSSDGSISLSKFDISPADISFWPWKNNDVCSRSASIWALVQPALVINMVIICYYSWWMLVINGD